MVSEIVRELDVRSGVIISVDELALAASDVDQDHLQQAGLDGLTVADFATLFADATRGANALEALGWRGKYYIKEVGGKAYVILKGPPSLRTALRGTRYLATNPRIVRVGLGPAATRGLLKRNVVIALTVFTAGAAVDVIMGKDMVMSEFVAEALVIGASAAAVTAITSAVLVALKAAVAAAVGTVVIAVLPEILATIAIGVMVSYAVGSLADELELTGRLSALLERAFSVFESLGGATRVDGVATPTGDGSYNMAWTAADGSSNTIRVSFPDPTKPPAPGGNVVDPPDYDYPFYEDIFDPRTGGYVFPEVDDLDEWDHGNEIVSSPAGDTEAPSRPDGSLSIKLEDIIGIPPDKDDGGS